MAVRKKTSGSVIILQLNGEFMGGDETDVLRNAILEAAGAGNTQLLLDLTHARMMNSTAMGVLTEALRNYRARNGAIRLCGLERNMTNLLVVTRLIHLFGHHATEAEALSAFATETAGA